MTTELEEKFFKTFGIKKWVAYGCNGDINCGYFNCNNCHSLRRNEVYPPITDHILLELILLLIKYGEMKMFTFFSPNMDELKEDIIRSCIEYEDDIKSDVRKLFEE